MGNWSMLNIWKNGGSWFGLDSRPLQSTYGQKWRGVPDGWIYGWSSLVVHSSKVWLEVKLTLFIKFCGSSFHKTRRKISNFCQTFKKYPKLELCAPYSNDMMVKWRATLLIFIGKLCKIRKLSWQHFSQKSHIEGFTLSCEKKYGKKKRLSTVCRKG